MTDYEVSLTKQYVYVVNFVTFSGTCSYIIATCVDKAAKCTVNLATYIVSKFTACNNKHQKSIIDLYWVNKASTLYQYRLLKVDF